MSRITHIFTGMFTFCTIIHSGGETIIAQINCVLWEGKLVCTIISSTGYNNNKLFNSPTLHLFCSTTFELCRYHQNKVHVLTFHMNIEWANPVTSSTAYSTTDIQQLFLGYWLSNYTVYSNCWPTLLFLLNRSSWSTNPDGMHQIPRKREKDQHSSGDWHQVLPVWSPFAREWHYSFHSS